MTIDLTRRLREHNTCKSRSTKAYVPWVLVYSEEFTSRLDARVREKYLKSGIGREFIREIISNRPRGATE